MTTATPSIPNPRVFREYDIRGVADRDLPDAFARDLGRAIGTTLARAGVRRMALGRDCRVSSARLHAALLEGLLLGERRHLPEEMEESFRNAGVYHLLAISGFNVGLIAGALFLIWLSRRRPYPLRPGDQALIFFIWYPIVRFLLETMRTGNWVVGGVATAQIMSILFALGAFLILLYRHRRRDDAGPADGTDDFDDFDEPDGPDEPDVPGAAATDADEDRMTDDGGAETERPREGG